jgi:short-subunit dehydrogenase
MEAFDGQVAFITGASSGIGAALARELARQGADVALCARRTDRLETLAWEVEATGRRAIPLTGDVTQDGSIEKAAASARQAFGKIDIVVANAGFGVSGPFERLTIDDFRRQFETNVFGVLRTLYATLDDLKRSRGRLVLIGSVSGHLSMPATSPYSMSKFAVRALSESLDYELKAAGVSVTLVSPGFVESELRRVDNQGAFRQEFEDEVPSWLRMPAEQAAKQMAHAIARREREVVLTFHGKAAVFLQRHAPWLLAAGMRRVRRG